MCRRDAHASLRSSAFGTLAPVCALQHVLRVLTASKVLRILRYLAVAFFLRRSSYVCTSPSRRFLCRAAANGTHTPVIWNWDTADACCRSCFRFLCACRRRSASQRSRFDQILVLPCVLQRNLLFLVASDALRILFYLAADFESSKSALLLPSGFVRRLLCVTPVNRALLTLIVAASEHKKYIFVVSAVREAHAM
eukprot:IDg12039t1